MHLLSRIDKLRAHACRFAMLPLTSVPSARVDDEQTEAWSKESYERDLEDDRKSNTRRALVLVGLGGLIVSAVLGTNGVAKADDLTFLQALNNHGILVYDTATALTWGHAICIALNQTTGDVVAANFYRITNSDIPDIATAVTWVTVAVEQICPWQDHRGQVTA